MRGRKRKFRRLVPLIFTPDKVRVQDCPRLSAEREDDNLIYDVKFPIIGFSITSDSICAIGLKIATRLHYTCVIDATLCEFARQIYCLFSRNTPPLAFLLRVVLNFRSRRSIANLSWKKCFGWKSIWMCDNTERFDSSATSDEKNGNFRGFLVKMKKKKTQNTRTRPTRKHNGDIYGSNFSSQCIRKKSLQCLFFR